MKPSDKTRAKSEHYPMDEAKRSLETNSPRRKDHIKEGPEVAE